MSFAREASRAIRSTFVLWILTAIIYPFVMIAIGQIAFPFQANGSMIKVGDREVGSALIGQPFTSDRYFNSRPSSTSYNSTADPKKDDAGVLKTGVSGASNLAPSNAGLLDRVKTDFSKSQKAGIQPTADLLYTLGSSLDPHITPEAAAAAAQVDRVTKARGLQRNQVEILISQNTDDRFLGIFGEPGVNVLKPNLALDKLKA
ncbi:MAG: K(+)-transporting ATPase subunit C [Plectolyngbya sp. WJT66-NPBG17]|jgi:K+-transporting ATPase ATPase C chain|nr:K(+)-transporting ATPase subunit C [Plectolyngbya sp. WJT66-NPBG17]